MSKTYEVTIDGTKYALQRFNLGKLKTLAKMAKKAMADDAAAEDQMEVGFEILKLAFEGSFPAVDDPEELVMSMDEFNGTLQAVMVAHGMRKAAEPGEAQAGAEVQT